MTESVLRQIKQFKSEDGINTNQLHSINSKPKKYKIKNIKNSLINPKSFPRDFFEPIKKEEEEINIFKSQQIYIDLQTEYDEDKELLDLLEGKGKKILFKINFIFRYKTK